MCFKNLPNLTDFTLYIGPGISNRNNNHIFRGMTNIRSIDLCGFIKIDDNTFNNLIYLTTIKLDHINVSSVTAFKNIKSLNFLRIDKTCKYPEDLESHYEDVICDCR